MKFQKGHNINKGRTPWNKGIIGIQKHTEKTRKKISEIQIGRKHTEETKKKMSEIRKGTHPTRETLKRMSEVQIGKHEGEKNHFFGKKHTIESRKKISDKQRGKIKEKSHNWKGGITPINLKIRNSEEYKLWRTAVFERDNYTCIWCGQVGGELNADHIQLFSTHPDLRFAIDNGRTLCKNCHIKRHSSK